MHTASCSIVRLECVALHSKNNRPLSTFAFFEPFLAQTIEAIKMIESKFGALTKGDHLVTHLTQTGRKKGLIRGG